MLLFVRSRGAWVWVGGTSSVYKLYMLTWTTGSATCGCLQTDCRGAGVQQSVDVNMAVLAATYRIRALGACGISPSSAFGFRCGRGFRLRLHCFCLFMFLEDEGTANRCRAPARDVPVSCLALGVSVVFCCVRTWFVCWYSALLLRRIRFKLCDTTQLLPVRHYRCCCARFRVWPLLFRAYFFYGVGG